MNSTIILYIPITLTSNDFFRVDLRVFLTGTVTAGAEAVFLLDRVRRAPSKYRWNCQYSLMYLELK